MKKSDIIEQLNNLPDDADIVQILPNKDDNPRTTYFPHAIYDDLHELDNEGITDTEFRNLIIKYLFDEDFYGIVGDPQKLNREAVITILDERSQVFHLNYEMWKMRNKK